MKHAATLLGLSACLAAIGHAATPPAGFEACSQLTDAAQRLGCYDARMAEFKSQAAAPAATTMAAPAVRNVAPPAPAPAAAPMAAASMAASPASPPPPPAAKFGEDDLPLQARPKPAAADEVLLSSITSVRVVAPKVFVISLANGQVWRQSGTQMTMFFRPGNDVRIEKGMLGDYRMSTTQTGAKNWVRVTRIQ